MSVADISFYNQLCSLSAIRTISSKTLMTSAAMSNMPIITGAVAESAGSEYLGSSAQNLAEKVQQKLEKKNDAK